MLYMSGDIKALFCLAIAINSWHYIMDAWLKEISTTVCICGLKVLNKISDLFSFKI